MKNIILSHTTALSALRSFRQTSSWDNTLINLSQPSTNAIHILCSSTNELHNNKLYIKHLRSHTIPKKSIIKINENFSCVNPELLIIQLARQLNFERLSLLVLEFCGAYTIDTENRTFINVDTSITKIEDIKKYASRYKEHNPTGHGLKKLEKIFDFCKDNSASPMESRLFIKLAGPRNKGFYGCRELELNQKVELSSASRKIAGQDYVIPDICSRKYKVAIEYDSSQFHENTIQYQRDKRRRDALVNDGWNVYSIVPQQINDPYIFHTIAKNILKALNQDSRLRGKHFEKLRNQAFEELK